MKRQTKTFIFYEIGDSCRSEFLMSDGKFHSTEDAVIIGVVKGKNVRDALKNLKGESPWIKKYRLDRLVAREAGKAIYL